LVGIVTSVSVVCNCACLLRSDSLFRRSTLACGPSRNGDDLFLALALKGQVKFTRAPSSHEPSLFLAPGVLLASSGFPTHHCRRLFLAVIGLLGYSCAVPSRMHSPSTAFSLFRFCSCAWDLCTLVLPTACCSAILSCSSSQSCLRSIAFL